MTEKTKDKIADAWMLLLWILMIIGIIGLIIFGMAKSSFCKSWNKLKNRWMEHKSQASGVGQPVVFAEKVMGQESIVAKIGFGPKAMGTTLSSTM